MISFCELFQCKSIHKRSIYLWKYLAREKSPYILEMNVLSKEKKSKATCFSHFFLRLQIPGISAFTCSNKAVKLSNGEEKEIWGKTHLDVKLSKSCCLKVDLKKILKNTSFFSLLMAEWVVGVGWVRNIFFPERHMVWG